MISGAFRLGVVEGPIVFDGTDYWADWPMGSYLRSVSHQWGQIDIYAPILGPNHSAHESLKEMRMDRSWARVHPLPEAGSGGLIRELIQQLRLLRFFCQLMRGNDWVLFFLPATYAFPAIIARRIRRQPYALYFGSDWDEVAAYNFRWGGTARSLKYWAYLKAGQILQRFAIQGAKFALTAGEALKQKIGRSGIPTFATVPRMNLTAKDIFIRENTCLGDTVTCLFVGSLIPRKGLNDLVDAFAELRRRRLSVVLRIVGVGELRQWLERRVNELGLAKLVEMTGHVAYGPGLWSLYRSSDIFVLPTHSEGFPRVLYEAMSQSLPIVTTKVSGIPYVMCDHENALLVPPGDTTLLADAIEELIHDSNVRRRLIENGLRVVHPILDADPGAQLRDLVSSHGL